MSRISRARPDAARLAPDVGEEAELMLDEIGARGDAVAGHDRGPIYVPFGLPGERVRAHIVGERADVLEVLTPSADRLGAPCRHFGTCGGCQLQHWREEPYLLWKRDQVVRALARRGITAEIDNVLPAWGVGRRRVSLHAERARRGVVLGFVERGGARITPVETCPVLTSGLQLALPIFRKIADSFAPARGEITLGCLETEAGIDVNVKGAGRASALARARLEQAADIADVGDLARLSLDGEPIVARRTPVLRMGAAVVEPPPGAFLQATQAGEDALVGLVLAALEGATHVVDLFSGCGTFALRVARNAETHALEGDPEMLMTLKRAADRAGGALSQVTTARRDLLRTPLSALEMKRYDAAVLDPPRAGARLQTQQLAASKLTRIASVSCDPATFARDARILIDAGFKLTRVTPIDQFRWTPHIELVGAFER